MKVLRLTMVAKHHTIGANRVSAGSCCFDDELGHGEACSGTDFRKKMESQNIRQRLMMNLAARQYHSHESNHVLALEHKAHRIR